MSNINVNTVTPDSGDKVSISGSLRISQSIYAPNTLESWGGDKYLGFRTSTGQITYFTGSLATGQKGQKGATGTKGQKGTIGNTGSGTKGQKGATGPMGPKGQKGQKGTTGTKGQKGAIGNNGPTGPSGPGVNISGTPVNNQLAVWTNSSTVEGDANVTFDTTTNWLNVTGSVNTTMLYANGSQVAFYNLPTSDPGVAGRVWRDGANLKISI